MTYPSITQQFESIGRDFNQNIPRVIIGKQNQNRSYNEVPNPPKPPTKIIGDDDLRKEEFYKKIEFWIFTVVVVLVLTYAGFRLIDMLLK